ncbi:hypothetical protein BDM02DRAFT_3118673 [Thelephora ganbajun]|uniref:Uncharacterized protein n=1 Tax=Thelephora ganbajun TaxID=370292 RepID=A0ACB6ZAQ2_THEGA|nr:hypothetical protein BDM02DRAFT_3118673 [Thelephora ganbajun]
MSSWCDLVQKTSCPCPKSVWEENEDLSSCALAHSPWCGIQPTRRQIERAIAPEPHPGHLPIDLGPTVDGILTVHSSSQINGYPLGVTGVDDDRYYGAE